MGNSNGKVTKKQVYKLQKYVLETRPDRTQSGGTDSLIFQCVDSNPDSGYRVVSIENFKCNKVKKYQYEFDILFYRIDGTHDVFEITWENKNLELEIVQERGSGREFAKLVIKDGEEVKVDAQLNFNNLRGEREGRHVDDKKYLEWKIKTLANHNDKIHQNQYGNNLKFPVHSGMNQAATRDGQKAFMLNHVLNSDLPSLGQIQWRLTQMKRKKEQKEEKEQEPEIIVKKPETTARRRPQTAPRDENAPPALFPSMSIKDKFALPPKKPSATDNRVPLVPVTNGGAVPVELDRRRLVSAQSTDGTNTMSVLLTLGPLFLLLAFFLRRFYAPVETSFDKKHDKTSESDDFSMV